MTTWEEAMARLELRVGWDEAEALTTIRKHIENLIEQRDAASANAATMSKLLQSIRRRLAKAEQERDEAAEELQRANRDCRAELEALMDANIYQQGRIEDQTQILKSLFDDRQQTIADLTEASQVERAAALVTIEELQRRIEELEKALAMYADPKN